MRTVFKLTKRLLDKAYVRLQRPHPFAFERVGFLMCRPGLLDDGGVVILAHDLQDVADEDYLDDPGVGAMMGPNAIRKALQTSYNHQASMFHVHLHLHRGKPHFSGVDETETAKFVPDFWNVQPGLPHGAIVLSNDSACGKCWIPGLEASVEISQFSVVGIPTRNL
jgi:hypothetical protein